MKSIISKLTLLLFIIMLNAYHSESEDIPDNGKKLSGVWQNKPVLRADTTGENKAELQWIYFYNDSLFKIRNCMYNDPNLRFIKGTYFIKGDSLCLNFQELSNIDINDLFDYESDDCGCSFSMLDFEYSNCNIYNIECKDHCRNVLRIRFTNNKDIVYFNNIKYRRIRKKL